MFLKDTPGRTAMHNEDFCSVALISYNRHDRLKHLIDSVHRHADMPFELVISDDGGNLYNDYNFINEFKHKISRININLGRNMGLHVNANNAIAMTRSKNVVLLCDDAEILAPFMRRAVQVLNHAPYVGTVVLSGQMPAPPLPEDPRATVPGNIFCKTPEGLRYGLTLGYGGTWAVAFRKDYWLEVGGYSEDSIYGDIESMNKGYERGYFNCRLEGDLPARDTDKDEKGLAHNSCGEFLQGGMQNYPRIFGISDDSLKVMDRQRSADCGRRVNEGRARPLNEFSWDWQDYLIDATADGTVQWDKLEQRHGRFLDQIKKDTIKS